MKMINSEKKVIKEENNYKKAKVIGAQIIKEN